METATVKVDNELDQKITPNEDGVVVLESETLSLVGGGCYGSGVIHIPK